MQVAPGSATSRESATPRRRIRSGPPSGLPSPGAGRAFRRKEGRDEESPRIPRPPLLARAGRRVESPLGSPHGHTGDFGASRAGQNRGSARRVLSGSGQAELRRSSRLSDFANRPDACRWPLLEERRDDSGAPTSRRRATTAGLCALWEPVEGSRRPKLGLRRRGELGSSHADEGVLPLLGRGYRLSGSNGSR
jgi:hypothetical protein